MVIHWQEEQMQIRSKAGEHSIPLDKRIHVIIVGYPDREEKTMQARDFGRLYEPGIHH